MEGLHIGVDRGHEGQPREIRQMVLADGRPKALLTHDAKIRPQRSSHVAFKDKVPLLCDAGEVVGDEPDLVHFTSQLSTKELLALVEPTQRVFLAFVNREGEFVGYLGTANPSCSGGWLYGGGGWWLVEAVR